MKHMAAGTFKARCLAVMKQVHATGEPVVVTKRGAPMVKVVPIRNEKDDIFGFLKDELIILGDIDGRPRIDPSRHTCARLAGRRSA